MDEILRYFYNKLINNKEINYNKNSNTYCLINNRLLNNLSLLLFLNGYILKYNYNLNNIDLYIENINIPELTNLTSNPINKLFENIKNKKDINYFIAYNLYHRILKSQRKEVIINKNMFIYNYLNHEVFNIIKDLSSINDQSLIVNKTSDGVNISIHKNYILKKKK